MSFLFSTSLVLTLPFESTMTSLPFDMGAATAGGFLPILSTIKMMGIIRAANMTAMMLGLTSESLCAHVLIWTCAVSIGLNPQRCVARSC